MDNAQDKGAGADPVFLPTSDDQVIEAVHWAVSSATPLMVRGSGSMDGFGRAVNVTGVLDVSKLAGVVDYAPEELLLDAKAGTPLAEIEAALAAENQMMAFEPRDLAPLLSGRDIAADGTRSGTLGGMVSTNVAGPRRIMSGAVRDHVLGFDAVSGRAEMFKSGGRVVKNVTGFDLSKLMTGAFGTLGVLTRVAIKVVPRADKTRTLLFHGLDAGRAGAVMRMAVASPNEVSGAAHLPHALAGRSRVDGISGAGRAVTAVRVEGPEPSVVARLQSLRALLGDLGGSAEELHSKRSEAFWHEVRDLHVLCGTDRADSAVWRISVAPTAGPDVLDRLSHTLGGEGLMDLSGGQVWFLVPPSDDTAQDGGAARVRAVVNDVGGHATLVRGPASVRAEVAVFHPMAEPLELLERRIKENFDPEGVLSPGRMRA